MILSSLLVTHYRLQVQMAVLSLQVEEMTSDQVTRKQYIPGQQLQGPRPQAELVQRADCHSNQAVGLIDPDKSQHCYLQPGALLGKLLRHPTVLAGDDTRVFAKIDLQHAKILILPAKHPNSTLCMCQLPVKTHTCLFCMHCSLLLFSLASNMLPPFANS